MATFINKKERVYDLKLTSYGHYLLSIGDFKPVYYGFIDNNVIYDGLYSGIQETQNDIQKRIKEDTEYIESLVLFEDVEDTLNSRITQDAADVSYFTVDVTPTMISPREDAFRMESLIGDAYIDGDQTAAAAWKIVALGGTILSSSLEDTKNNIKYPQVNLEMNYLVKIKEDTGEEYTEEELRNSYSQTDTFADNKYILIEKDDAMIYIEELNTEMLTNNFDIEVFEIEPNGLPASSKDLLKEKIFLQRPRKNYGRPHDRRVTRGKQSHRWNLRSTQH